MYLRTFSVNREGEITLTKNLDPCEKHKTLKGF